MDTAAYSILVAHRDVRSRYELAYALRDAGFQTVQADCGARALQFAPHVSAALLHVDLPDLSGPELCRILRSKPVTARMPIVSVAAHAGDARSAVAAGANAFLAMPVDPGTLHGTFAELLATGGP